MPFVRAHGNQLAIVHGSRREGKVVQDVLFTLYSQAEAREALGRGSEAGAWHFERMLTEQNPGVRFDWPKIREEIAARLDHLPEAYDHREVRLKRDFREALVAFTRQLLLADPQLLDVATEVLAEQRAELEYVQECIAWRLRMARERRPSEYAQDNPFLWRYQGHAREVSPEADEEVHTLFEAGKFDEVVPRARLLCEAFPTFADGFNLLGLVALERGQLDEAVDWFRKTVEVGRTLFPKRIPKDDWWTDHATRPYMRGLGNLTIALNRAGRYDEALAACDQLAHCGDEVRVRGHRGPVLMNLGRYEEAVECLAPLTEMWAREGFTVAFALLSLGREAEARPFLLRGALSHPRLAHRLVGGKLAKARSREDADDDRAFRDTFRDLHGWFSRPGTVAMAPLRTLLRQARVQAVLQEIADLAAQDRRIQTPEAFARLQTLRSAAFARGLAQELAE